MSWYEMNQQRRKNRGERGSDKRYAYREGHARRHGFSVIMEKKTGEIVAMARNGCFGRLAEINQDLYDEWAHGTRGAS